MPDELLIAQEASMTHEPSGLEEKALDTANSDTTTEDSTSQKTEESSVESTEDKKAAESTESTTTEQPAYKPDFKYRGAEQDREVPEYLRPLLTSKEAETEVKSLLAKADGLDLVKARAEDTRKERDQHKTSFNSLKSQVDDARETYQRGDVDSFLNLLGIPEQRMLQWALEKVKYSQLPPDQKKLIDDKRAADRQVWDQQKQSQNMENSRQSREAEILQTSLNYEFMRPEVSEFQKSFDEAVGKPGAFIEEVKNRGELAWSRSGGKTIRPVGEVIQEVMQSFGSLTKARGAQQTPGTPTAKTAATPAPKIPASTIPNVSGKSASPVSTGPSSLDDLRKLAKEASEGKLPAY